MNDFHMNHLARDRQHDFQREAARNRLARSASHPGHKGAPHERDIKPRSTLRLTLDYVFGRAAL